MANQISPKLFLQASIAYENFNYESFVEFACSLIWLDEFQKMPKLHMTKSSLVSSWQSSTSW